MNSLRIDREAKEYLILRILAEADRDDIPLSEVERNILYFSETDWTLPNMMAISQKFDQTYNQDEYERKIGQLIRRFTISSTTTVMTTLEGSGAASPG